MPMVCLSSNHFYKVRFYVISNLLLKMVVRQSWLGKEHIALFSGVCLYTYIYPRIMDLSGWQNMCVQNLFTPFLYLIDAIWVVECMQNWMEWMFRSEVDAKFQLKCEVQNAPTTPQKEEEERKKGLCLYSVAEVFESKWCFKSVAGLWISSGLFCYIEVHHYMCLQNLHVRV